MAGCKALTQTPASLLSESSSKHLLQVSYSHLCNHSEMPPTVHRESREARELPASRFARISPSFVLDLSFPLPCQPAWQPWDYVAEEPGKCCWCLNQYALLTLLWGLDLFFFSRLFN